MKLLYLTSLLSFLPLCISSCSQTAIEEAAMEKSTTREGQMPFLTCDVNIEGTKANFFATCISNGNEIKKAGFVYSYSNKMPVIKGDGCNYRTVLKYTEDSIAYVLQNVKLDSTYYVRSYVVTANADTCYSSVVAKKVIAEKSLLSTYPVKNRAKKGAVVSGRFLVAGNVPFKKFGCVLGDKPCPTVKEGVVELAADTALDARFHGTFGVFFDNLQEGKLYYTRSFVVTSNDTIYGENRMFKTATTGNVSWNFNDGVDKAKEDGRYEEIVRNMENSVQMYQDYSTLNKHMYCNYYGGSQWTADCSITGWMRLYTQWSQRTIMHEMQHANGIGTCGNWNSASLWKNSLWQGQEGILTVRAMMMDQKQELHQSGVHIWPGGLNFESEVNGTSNSYNVKLKGDRVYKMAVLLVNAMTIDGLNR